MMRTVALLHLFVTGLELLHGRNVEGKRRAQFVVNSPSCRIPDYDPYDKSIAGIVSKWPPLICSSLPPLTTVTGTYYRNSSAGDVQSLFHHVLHLHQNSFHHYGISRYSSFCYYKLITRDSSDPRAPDDGFRLSASIRFSNTVIFRGSEEFIWVTCVDATRTLTAKRYVNMHAFIGYKQKAFQKVKVQNFQPRNKPSVMILGFDSMSRLNLIRTMPKTVNYLQKTGWYDFKGFNKIGDNTFPNIMAALTGLNLQQITSCLPRAQFTPMNNCPIIWDKFSEKGYITAYGEDQPIISSFNSIKFGFNTPPTDYYLRPFVLAAHKLMELKEVGPILRGQHRIACYGPTKAAKHFFDYSLDFLKTFDGYQTFSLFWQNGFSHEHLNGPSAMDDTVLSYFVRLASSGVLDRTLVIFMSDHGFRFDEIRETFLGYLEERLPFLYIWVPDKDRKAYPTLTKRLKENRNRLTSPFDIYMTLLNVLGSKGRPAGCPRCRSLFNWVPWNRSCKDAGIVDHWCTCAEYADIDTTSPLAVKLANSAVKVINDRLRSFRSFTKPGSSCATLQLNSVVSLRKKRATTSDNAEFIVAVQTNPGNGKFEATMKFSDGWQVVGDISRINRYNSQSSCADHKVLRTLCYCIYS